MEEELRQLQSSFAIVDIIQSNTSGIGLIIKKLKNIKIKIYQEPSHSTPHLHIDYKKDKHSASYNIKTGNKLVGNLPNKYDKEVKNWILINKVKLLKIWSQVQNGDKKNYELSIQNIDKKDQPSRKKQKPLLRFKNYNNSWFVKKYNDIYSFHSTNSLSRDKLNYEKGKVKNIHYGDIHKQFSTIFDIKNEIVPFINNDVDISKIKEDSYCKEGDLVIADASEDYDDIGKLIELINLNNEKIVAGLHTFLARPKNDDLVKGFAAYLMQSWKFRKQVMTIAQGTKVLSLSTGRLSRLILHFPSPPEQKKIATFLSSLDKKITQLSQKKTLLESYKKGIMQKIFSQEIRFKDDDGSNYPDWEEKKLGEIGEMTSSKRVYLSDYVDDGIPFYRGKEISELKNNLKPSNMLFITEKRYLEYKFKYGVPKIDDILITAVGTLGNILRINNNDPFYFKDGNLIWLRKIKEYSKFIEIIIQWNRKKLIKTSIGSTQKALTMVELRKIKLSIPCLSEQQKIAFFSSSIDKKIELVNTQLEQTKVFKKGLLQQMFV